MVYFHPKWQQDVFPRRCSTDLTNKSLLQFLKPMDGCTSRGIEYDFYAESEWRIIAGIGERRHHDGMIDPRNTTDSRVAEYFNSLAPQQQERLRYLVPVDRWLAAIIYPSLSIKKKAQEEESRVQMLIRRIARNAQCVERDNLPVELDLDICRNLYRGHAPDRPKGGRRVMPRS